MSKRTKIIIGAAIVILIACGLFFWLSASRGTPVSGTLSDLAALKTPSKCYFNYSDDSVTSAGTVYVSGGMLRGDFTFDIVPSGQHVTTHVIEKAGTRYSWGADSSVGSQAAVSSSTDASGVNTLYHYTCSSVTVDPSLFDLPPGIAFVQE
jgi:hypothetical protein